MRLSLLRVAPACAAVLWCALTAAAPAAAAGTLPANATVRAGRVVDAESFARVVTSRYHVAIQRIVVADIDRDGDSDVLTAGDYGITVWVNDGEGLLQSQSPRHGSGLAGRPPSPEWRDRGSAPQSSVQGSTSPTIVLARAHAPPLVQAESPRRTGALQLTEVVRSSSVPRAPPASIR